MRFILFFLFLASISLQAEKPNIILFLIDDQDKASIGAYGGNTLTPNLDRMASEGMLFHRAYASSTVCNPSRYSFHTGRYAGNCYYEGFTRAFPSDTQSHIAFNTALEADNMNVGAVLAQNGYATGFTGKYHIDGHEGVTREVAKEFGLTFIPNEAKASPEISEAFRKNELRAREIIMSRGFTWAKNIYLGNMQPPYRTQNPEWNLEAAFEFIEANVEQDKPFYLSFCLTLLHDGVGSWPASLDFPQHTGSGEVEPDPAVIEHRKRIKEIVANSPIKNKAQLTGEVWVDATMGLLMDKLKALGIDENTLVVFAPDHGITGKGSIYDKDSANIPMIMRWPNGIPAGIESSELVQNIDLVPTFFDIAGASVPADYPMDGISLSPLLETGTTEPWRDFLYFELGCSRGIMSKEWNYIANRYTADRLQAIQENTEPQHLPALLAPLERLGIGTRGATHPGFFQEDQLYSLKNDPGEMQNLANSPEHHSVLKAMQAQLGEVLETIGQPYGEFIEGRNTTHPGQIDQQVSDAQQIRIEHKTVFVPESLGGGVWKDGKPINK
ncbi:MAG: sulfatase family protein [Coraliomargarita sp.]